ncbi:MAG: Ig-like domain-containing protein [Spirochaetales bacterium]|nr:Ig-like domain-containing protein [Spirochaetales bacterium]
MRKIKLIILTALLCPVLWAMGRDDTAYDRAEGVESWSYEYDLQGREEGKYNVIVKGVDKAGNVTQAGPYNIMIDGDSDLPRVAVVSPGEGSLIKDNLNIVGSAADDDGVAYVEISMDGGAWARCEGKDFWSYYVSRDDLKDGSHDFKVRATDINGLTGSEQALKFDMDKDIPQIIISSHEKGAYLSDTVDLMGTVQDTSGLNDLWITHRETDETERIKLKYDKDSGLYHFTYKINTKDLEEGVHNLMLSCTDISGSRGEENFLFYADNTPPDITILTPKEGSEVNGKLILSGYAGDAVGVKRIFCRIDEEELEADVIPGSSFWYLELNLAERDFGNHNVEIVAEDNKGNFSIEKLKFENSEESDLPKLSLFGTSLTGTLEKTVQIGLMARDDDGIQAIEYALDEEAFKTKELSEGFVLSLSDLSPGKHTLNARAIDMNNLAGETESLSFIVPKPSERAPLSAVSDPIFDGESDITYLEEGLSLTGKAPGRGITLEYALLGVDKVVYKSLNRSGDGSFTITIPSDMADGQYALSVRALSSEGNRAENLILISRDEKAPELTLLAPLAEEALNGKIVLAGLAHDLQDRPTVELSDDGETFVPLEGGRSFYRILDLNSYEETPEFTLRLTDKRGHSQLIPVPVTVEKESDYPSLSLHYPLEDSLVTGPVKLTGTATDDDGIGSFSYKVGEGEWVEAPGGHAFSLPFDPAGSPDGDFTVFVKCADVNGLESEVIERTFPVSRKAPEINLTAPVPSDFLQGSFVMSGTARDDNGIEAVYVSTDNGFSYNRVQGEEEWSYDLDTAVLTDGTFPVFIKAVDRSGMESYFTSLINVDNRAPEIKLDYPQSNEKILGAIDIKGVVTDLNDLAEVQYTLTARGNGDVTSEEGIEEELSGSLLDREGSSLIMNRSLDLAGRNPGWYAFSLTAVDKAGNRSRVSRDVYVNETSGDAGVALLYPLDGASRKGFVNVEGRVYNVEKNLPVQIILDGKMFAMALPDDKGFFFCTFEEGVLNEGIHTLKALYGSYVTEERVFNFSSEGPWISFEGYKTGDYLTERTFITGRTGYVDSAVAKALAMDKKERENKDIAYPILERIEYSFDKGRTFSVLPGNKVSRKKGEESASWKVRIETELYPDGDLPIIAKAYYDDGSQVVEEILLRVDKKAPQVTIDTPSEGEGFNDKLIISGSSEDGNGMDEVTLLLREGDKSGYELPSFVQGLYLDFHALGATYGDVGAGLTFFDDNVKLQGQAGVAPSGRFSGLVIGGKLLANVANIPYSYFLGPDWSDFSTSLALGANFSYFTMSGDELSFSGDGVMLGSILGQWEIIKFETENWSALNDFSLYAEGSLWFISSDVEAGTVARFSLGARLGVF